MRIKEEYPDAILFFRMGDFYEMFFEDAQIASRTLGITLTARGTHKGEKVPMCGVPHHAHNAYVGKLVDSGRKVAICEQMEDPKVGKGIVKREVVRLVTPGSIIDEGDVDEKSHLYMGAISAGPAGDSDRDEIYGLAHLELSTGEFKVTEVQTFERLLDELGRIDPAELIIPGKGLLSTRREFSRYRLEILERDLFDSRMAGDLLKEQLGVRSLAFVFSRSAQYVRRRGSSGEAFPRTMTCRSMGNQLNFSR